MEKHEEEVIMMREKQRFHEERLDKIEHVLTKFSEQTTKSVADLFSITKLHANHISLLLRVLYGTVGIILVAVVGAVLNLVIKGDMAAMMALIHH